MENEMIDFKKYPHLLGNMRLREILHLIKENKNHLNLEVEVVPNNGLYKYKKVRDYIGAIKNIKTINLFEFDCDKILSVEDLSISNSDTILLAQNFHQFISQTNNTLVTEMHILEKVLGHLLIEQEAETISIKLPEITNLEDLLDFISDLQKIVLRPLTLFAEQAKVQNFDVGSNWLEILFYSSVAYRLVKSIISVSFDIYIEKIKKQKAVDELKRQIDVPINIIEELTRVQQNQLKVLLEEKVKVILNCEASKELIKSKEKTETQYKEIEVSYYTSINKMVELIEKKMEIQLSLTATSENKKGFPDFSKKLELLKQEKIEDKSN